jgi:hypothetical protein
MRHSSGEHAFCVLCVLAGVVAPWFFLIAGAVLSLLDISSYLNQSAAYLVAIGLTIMAASYFLSHFAPRASERDRR